MEKFKLLVIGHGRHGKDTVCEILRDKYNYTFESSSKFCSKLFIYDNLKDKYNYKEHRRRRASEARPAAAAAERHEAASTRKNVYRKK